MDNSEKNNAPEDDIDLARDVKRPKLWGFIYLILGIIGLATSLYSGYYDLNNIVPLFGTVVAGVLIAALSILIIIYGYRLIRKDI
jgi:hypothetical protein